MLLTKYTDVSDYTSINDNLSLSFFLSGGVLDGASGVHYLTIHLYIRIKYLCIYIYIYQEKKRDLQMYVKTYVH